MKSKHGTTYDTLILPPMHVGKPVWSDTKISRDQRNVALTWKWGFWRLEPEVTRDQHFAHFVRSVQSARFTSLRFVQSARFASLRPAVWMGSVWTSGTQGNCEQPLPSFPSKSGEPASNSVSGTWWSKNANVSSENSLEVSWQFSCKFANLQPGWK